jgi:hypothetical protein
VGESSRVGESVVVGPFEGKYMVGELVVRESLEGESNSLSSMHNLSVHIIFLALDHVEVAISRNLPDLYC